MRIAVAKSLHRAGLGFAVVFLIAGSLPVEATSYRKAVPAAHDADRDCVPLNGRSGYYGNPWCDTGSYRLEDIWFRENHRLYGPRRHKHKRNAD